MTNILTMRLGLDLHGGMMTMVLHDPSPLTSFSSVPEAPSPILIEQSDVNGAHPQIHNAILRNCKLHNVRVYNSCVVDCVITGPFTVLVECSITQSSLRDAKLHGCSVFSNTVVCRSVLRECSTRTASLDNCIIQGSVINHSVVQGGSIKKFGVENSDVLGVGGEFTIENSKLNPCKLSGVKFVDSTLHQSTQISQTSLSRCQVTRNSLALRRFPPEIRKLIFEEAFSDKERYLTSADD